MPRFVFARGGARAARRRRGSRCSWPATTRRPPASRSSPRRPARPDEDVEPFADPYAWDPERADEFARRAAAGNSHLLYALSPGGAVASAERTARWRPLVERAAEQAGVDADTLEGLVFLESAGRADARAPGGLESRGRA